MEGADYSNIDVEKCSSTIALFMGWKIDNSFPDKDKIYKSPKGDLELLSTMKFHSSWDWLMPVIKKCYLIESPTGNGWSKADRIQTCIDFNSMLQNDAMDIFVSVVAFIKWYNTCLKENGTNN